MKNLKTIFKIILALIFGLLFSLYILQHQADFKQLAEQKSSSTAYKLFKYNFKPTIDKLELFWPNLNFKNLSVSKESSDNWHWEANNFNIDFSWLELFINQKLQLNNHVEKLSMFSVVADGQPAIINHFKELFLKSRFIVPVNIKNFTVKDCSFQCLEPASGIHSFIRTNIDLKESPDYFKSHFFLKDGSLSLNQFDFFKKLSGSLHAEIPRKNVPPMLNADLTFQIPTTTPKDCFLSGKFHNNQGDFYLRSLDDELIVTPITINSTKTGWDFTAQGQMPVSYLENLFSGISVLDMMGDCNFAMVANIGKKTMLHGHMQIKDLLINSLNAKIDEAKFFFKRKNQICKYNFILTTKNKLELTGSLVWNEKTKQGKILLENPDDIWVSNNKIAKNNLNISLQFSNNNMWGTYQCNMLANRKEVELKGKIIANKKILKIIGTHGETYTNIEVELRPKPFLKKVIFKGPKENLVNIQVTKNELGNQINAKLEFSEIKKLLPEAICNQLSGKGLINIIGSMSNNKFIGKVEVKDGNLIILNSYNIIKNLNANINFDTKEKSLNLSDVQVQLEKGLITISNAKLELDEQNNLNFVHAPIIFNDCFLFWNNIFGTTSGKLLINKKEGVGQITGKIILDNAKIRSNIFSSEFGTKTFNSKILDGWNASIILKSRNPIKIKTSMLDCLAKLDIKISSSIAKPELEGQIQLLEGSLFFPYKPLKITGGNIIFIPGASLDPIVELTAKTKIRNFLVSMFVTGSANNAHIKLDSVPTLTEEQIGCLLLAGSENASLNLIVPTLIMQNLKSIIFDSTQVQEKLEKYYQTILKPFKHIRFAPTFIDETGRGGFRGGIEIDVSDRLHALIQKNFSMPEDTKFEVDYQITDDISIRAIKDERGDLGGEIEMRWKF
jgi:hypothetical protein